MKKCVLFIFVGLCVFGSTGWSVDFSNIEVPDHGSGYSWDTSSYSEGYRKGYEIGYNDALVNGPWRQYVWEISGTVYISNFCNGVVAGYRAGREALEGPTMVTNNTRIIGDSGRDLLNGSMESTDKDDVANDENVGSKAEDEVLVVSKTDEPDTGKILIGTTSTITKTSERQAGAQRGAQDAVNGVGYLTGISNASKEWIDGYHEAYFKALGGLLPPAGF